MSWFKRKVTDPLLNFLSQGISPSSLAWAFTAGITIACIPVFGSATILCLLAIWLFRLNPAAVLLSNQLAYPLQFILYLPFLRVGEWLFDAPPVPLSISKIFELASTDLWGVISMLWVSNMFGLLIYLMLCAPTALLLYYILNVLFTRLSLKLPGRSGK